MKPETQTTSVSIIIPCYNGAVFIQETVQSVLQQTWRDFELIIVNDGSTDESEEKILGFTDNRIRYFRCENRGQSAALNTGINQARGEYIHFLDADDLLNEVHIEKMMKRVKGNCHSIAFCDWMPFYDNDLSTSKLDPLPNRKDMKPADWLKIELRQYCDMVAGWRWLIPAKLLKEAGGWDERLTLNNDFEFSLRLLSRADRILFADGAKVYYRWATPQGLSQKQSKKSFQDAILSTDLGCSYLLEMENSEEMKKICSDRYRMWLTRIPEEFVGLRREVSHRTAR